MVELNTTIFHTNVKFSFNDNNIFSAANIFWLSQHQRDHGCIACNHMTLENKQCCDIFIVIVVSGGMLAVLV